MTLAASALYGSLLAILSVGLAMNVSRNRGRANTFFGHGNDEALESAVRAHGNAAENVPLGIVLLVIAETSGANGTAMHSLGGALLLGRILSAHGLLSRTNGSRVGGILLTWLSLLGAAGYTLFLRFGG